MSKLMELKIREIEFDLQKRLADVKAQLSKETDINITQSRLFGESVSLGLALNLVQQLDKYQELDKPKLHYCNTGDCEYCKDDCTCKLGNDVEIENGHCISYHILTEYDPATLDDLAYEKKRDAELEKVSGF